MTRDSNFKVTVVIRRVGNPGNIEMETSHKMWVAAPNSGIALMKVGAVLSDELKRLEDITEIQIESDDTYER